MQSNNHWNRDKIDTPYSAYYLTPITFLDCMSQRHFGKKSKPSLKLFYGLNLVKIFSTCDRNANPHMYIIIGWTRTQSPNLELSIYFSYWQRNWRCHRYNISAMTESLNISLRLKNNPFSTSIIPILIHSRCDNIVFTLDKPYFVSTAWYDNSIFTLDNLCFSSFFTDNVRILYMYYIFSTLSKYPKQLPLLP